MIRTIARTIATAFAWGLCLSALYALLIVTP